MGLPEAVDLLQTLPPVLGGNLVQPVQEGNDPVIPDQRPGLAQRASVAELELVGQPLDDRLALLGPGGKGEELGDRARRIAAGDFEKITHELQGFGGLARAGKPGDQELPARLLIGRLDAQHLIRLSGGLSVGQLDQLRGIAHPEMHLGGMLERALEAIHNPL